MNRPLEQDLLASKVSIAFAAHSIWRLREGRGGGRGGEVGGEEGGKEGGVPSLKG